MIPHFFKLQNRAFVYGRVLVLSRSEIRFMSTEFSFLYLLIFSSVLRNKADISWAWFWSIIKAYFYSAISSFLFFWSFAFLHSIGAMTILSDAMRSSSECVLLRLFAASMFSFDISTVAQLKFHQFDNECIKSWKLSFVQCTAFMYEKIIGETMNTAGTISCGPANSSFTSRRFRNSKTCGSYGE